MSAVPKLNATYFRLCRQEEKDGYDYYAFEMLRPGAVLINTQTNEPFACVMFQAHGENMAYAADSSNNHACAARYANTAVYPREPTADARPRLHAVVDADAQFTEFVLTNLSADGMLNINLIKEAAAAPGAPLVREVNPVGGMNAINELRPLQSFKVFADHTAGDTKMVLRGVTRAVVNPLTGATEQRPLSVQADAAAAAAADTKAETVEFVPSVVPQVDAPELKTAFAHLEWRVVDMVCLKRRCDPYASLFSDAQPQSQPLSHIGGVGGGFESLGRSFGGGVQAASRAYGNHSFSFGSERAAMAEPPPSARGWLGDLGLKLSDHAEPRAPAGPSGSAQAAIMQSQAARFEAGERAAVHVYDTGREYAYELCSPPCVVTMSVSLPVEESVAEQWRAQAPDGARRMVPLQDARVPAAHAQWIAGNKPDALRSVQWPSADQRMWFAVDFARMVATTTGVDAPRVQFSTVERTPAHTRFKGGVLPAAPPTADERRAQALELFRERHAGEARGALAAIPKIFKSSDKCVICLDDAPTTVLAMCGHQCVCASSACFATLTKCPLCRQRVTAKVAVPA